jgi:phosphoglucosamine mutase
MLVSGAILGGEKSGHILFTEETTTGDGLLTALQVLRLCRESGRRLSEWADEMEEYPQRLVSVPVRERDGWNRVPQIAEAVRRAEGRLGERGRINVRPSGTEKKIRVMVEGPDLAEVEELVSEVAGALRKHLGA